MRSSISYIAKFLAHFGPRPVTKGHQTSDPPPRGSDVINERHLCLSWLELQSFPFSIRQALQIVERSTIARRHKKKSMATPHVATTHRLGTTRVVWTVIHMHRTVIHMHVMSTVGIVPILNHAMKYSSRLVVVP